MDNDALLAELRAVFRDELEDHLATLEREVVVLARPDAAPGALRAAAREIYRVVHSLKGAARAVDMHEVESVCHALENALAPVRSADARLDADAIRTATERAMETLRAWADAHLAGAHAAGASAGASAGAVVGASAGAVVGAVAGAVDRQAVRSSPRIRIPRIAGERAGTDGESEQATEEDLALAGADTVRVSAERMGRLLSQSEELVTITARGGRARDGFAVFDDTLAELRRQLGAVRRAVRRGSPAATAATSAMAALQTLSVWFLDQRRQQRAAWDEATVKATTLAHDTRLLRLARLSNLSPVLERAVLDAARSLGKQVTFAMHDDGAEVDRRVIEHLRDPLIQILRNAVDHGIEPPEERVHAGKPAAGRIEVHVRAAGSDAILQVRDDGRGFDLARVREVALARGMAVHADDDRALLELVLEPGFSTRASASATSGRGMGLDIVRQRVAAMQGRLTLDSAQGAGAGITIRVPVDLGVMCGLVVEVRGARFILVQTAVETVLRLRPGDTRTVEGRRHLLHEGSLIPLADLGTALGLGRGRACRDTPRPCVLLASAQRRVAYTVDALGALRDIVIKPLGPRVRRAGFVTGAALVGQGEVACVLDASALARYGRAEEGTAAPAESARPTATILVVDDSVTTRQLLRSILESAGYACEVAVDGEAAWHRLAVGAPVDLVVSDIEMPRLDGFQLLSRVRSSPRTAHLPFVLVTALSDDADRRRALELGADAYVIKARFDQQALLGTVEELLP